MTEKRETGLPQMFPHKNSRNKPKPCRVREKQCSVEKMNYSLHLFNVSIKSLYLILAITVNYFVCKISSLKKLANKKKINCVLACNMYFPS